jgi:hypothetical protein
MKIEDLFEIEQKQDSGRTKQILSNLYDEDKLDFNTELTSSNISLFTEMDLIAGDDPKWTGSTTSFIYTREKLSLSIGRADGK